MCCMFFEVGIVRQMDRNVVPFARQSIYRSDGNGLSALCAFDAL